MRPRLRRDNFASQRHALLLPPSARLMLVGFRAAHDQPAAEELLVVQFLHCALCFLNGLHLHKCKTL